MRLGFFSRVLFGLALFGARPEAVASGVAGNLYPNGDFEAGHTPWTLPKNGFWSFRDGEGRGGSRALVLEQPTNAPFMWPVMDSIKVEPGAVYRFFMWVKKDSYDAPRGRLYVSFGWKDAAGKEIDGCEGILDSEHNNAVDGWCLYEAKTGPMPRHAASGAFSIWMSQSVSGRLRFDDFSIMKLPTKPVVPTVVTSAYQDRLDRGPVKLVAEYVVNPEKYPDARLEGVFDYPTAKGGHGFARATVGDGYAVGSLEAADLPVGTNAVEFVLSCDGREIARGDVAFERTAAPPTRKVMFDARHRTLVDGKRFFPLGMYWAGVTEKALDKYKEAPFNCLMPYQGPETNMLDACVRRDLKVIYCMKSGWQNAADPAKEEAYVARFLRFKDHPSILAWYICDELPSSYAPYLIRRHRRVRELDAEHPTWIVLAAPNHTRFFLGGFDAIGNDPYPLGYHKAGLERVSLVSENPKVIDGLCFGMRPQWQVPQVFDWGHYFPDEAEHPNVRRPTLGEMRSMTWQAVAAGVNGLVYYSYFDIWKDKDPAACEAHWQDVVTLAKEVRKMERVLLSDDRPFALGGADAAKLVWRCYSCDGADWLLVANRHNAPFAARLTLPAKAASLDVALGGGVVLAADGSALAVDFPPLGYAFLKLNNNKE